MKENQICAIGYAILKEPQAFRNWLMEAGLQKSKYNAEPSQPGWYKKHWSDYFYGKQEIFSGKEIHNIFESDSVNDSWGQQETDGFFTMLSYLDSIGQKLVCFYYDPFACLVGYGKNRYIMPSEWVHFSPFKEYGDLVESDFLTLGGPVAGGSLPAVISGLSKNSITTELERREDAIEQLRQEQKRIEDGSTKELEPLKKQIEALQEQMKKQQEKLLSELQVKKEELDKIKKELEQKLFLLETQIYGIRCYLGEVVNFHKICEGKPAPCDEPVIVHQKIRFLDEELGKAVSIYGFGGSERDTNTFLQILKYRSDIRQMFVPDERCITILRVSRSGTVKGVSDVVANSLQDYKTYHGGQLAILLKNGEELYIAWLDDDKIVLNDENAFYSPSLQKTERQYEETDFVHSSSMEEIISRYFLLSIIQGISDQGKIISFPEKINILSAKQRYIIFSMADGRLADNRFGTFSDILARVSDIPMKEGDIILTGLTITRDDIYNRSGRSQYESYNNNRGIGEKNRTHDAYLDAYKIMPVNKVLYDLKVDYNYQKIKGIAKMKHEKTGEKTSTTKYWEEDTGEIIGTGTEQISYPYDSVESYKKYWLDSIPTEAELLHLKNRYGISFYYISSNGAERIYHGYDHKEPKDIYWKKYTSAMVVGKTFHYFLAAKKEYSSTTANMEVYENEVIPLAYLCATWVQYAITTGNIGDWRIENSRLSYADSLLYLNIMLEYLKNRQAEEFKILKEAGLSKWLNDNPEWDVTLAEWRIENRIRKLTPYSARKFAKTI